KSVSRLGCFGCHDVPGFESSKPIGTALNDWGKKDPERLAFEDADSYVREHYNIVPARQTKQDLEARVRKLDREGRIKELQAKGEDDLTPEEKFELIDLTAPDPAAPDNLAARKLRTPLTDFDKEELNELRAQL